MAQWLTQPQPFEGKGLKKNDLPPSIAVPQFILHICASLDFGFNNRHKSQGDRGGGCMGAVNVPLRLLQWTVASFIEKIQEDMLRDASQNVRKCVHRGFRQSLQALSQVILKTGAQLSSHII